MNKTFTRLKDSTLESGVLQINPALSQDFKLATETFTSLAKAASERRTEEDDEAGDTREHSGEGIRTTNLASRRANVAESEDPSIGWGYSRMNPDENPDSANFTQTNPIPFSDASVYGQSNPNGELIRRRQFTVGDVMDQSRSSHNASDQPSLLPFGLVDLDTSQPFQPPSPRMYPVSIPSPRFPPQTSKLSTPCFLLPNPLTLKNLSHLTTQSLDAPSFARRLARAAAETAFQLLIVAEARPAAMSYVFRFQLPLVDTDQLLARFKALVSRHPEESLDDWDIPYIHLGGSGTHYPRLDALGQPVRPKNSWKAQQLGPLEDKRAGLINVEDGRMLALEGVDFTNLEGDWFDAEDVSGYLKAEYGCKLHSKSLFVECELDDEDDDPFSRFLPYEPAVQRSPGGDVTSPSPSHRSASTVSTASAAATPPPNYLGIPYAFGDRKAPFSQASTQNPYAEYPKSNNSDMTFDQVLGLHPSMGFEYGWQDSSIWNGVHNPWIARLKQKRKKKAWMDVNKLIDGK